MMVLIAVAIFCLCISSDCFSIMVSFFSSLIAISSFIFDECLLLIRNLISRDIIVLGSSMKSLVRSFTLFMYCLLMLKKRPLKRPLIAFVKIIALFNCFKNHCLFFFLLMLPLLFMLFHCVLSIFVYGIIFFFIE